MSHIYQLTYIPAKSEDLSMGAPLGQVKDCLLEFLCSLDRLKPKDCPNVILIRFRQGLATPGFVKEHSDQNLCSIGCDMSRDEAYIILFTPEPLL